MHLLYFRFCDLEKINPILLWSVRANLSWDNKFRNYKTISQTVGLLFDWTSQGWTLELHFGNSGILTQILENLSVNLEAFQCRRVLQVGWDMVKGSWGWIKPLLAKELVNSVVISLIKWLSVSWTDVFINPIQLQIKFMHLCIHCFSSPW